MKLIILSVLLSLSVSAKIDKEKLSKIISESIYSKSELPKLVSLEDEDFNIIYSVDEKLQAYIKKILLRYRSDYAAVVVIDNNSGNILSMVGTERINNKMNMSLALSSTHPAASVFKIITAANLMNESELSPEDKICYRGRGKTLYKYQLKDKESKWNRHVSLQKGFTYSNNVVFGKAAIENSSALSLFKTSFGFGFNDNLLLEVDTPMSVVKMPENEYQLAELASGFNKDTMISPLHAAHISSIIANDGMKFSPRLIKEVSSVENNQKVLVDDFSQGNEQVISKEAAHQMKHMMELVVNKGTAKLLKYNMKRKIRNKLDIGGKTGSITGGTPYGKRDWITAYAIPKNQVSDSGISISVMNVNKNKWYIKSTELAGKIINYYYKNKK